MKKYRQEIGIFILFLILFLAVVINTNFYSLDELWVFNTARNVANGLLPYKDFNLITTPGIAIICGFVLKIFGTELIIMRIMCCILAATIFVVIYKIINIFKINKYINLLILLLYFSLTMLNISINYNLVNLFISLVILYFELKSYDETNDIFTYNFKKDFLLGIWAGFSIFFKQTTGLFLIVCFSVYKILAIRNKDELKKALKIMIIRLFGAVIPIIILAIYLLVNNLISEFIDYTILGVLEFSNKVSYINLLLSDIGFLALISPFIIIVAFYKGVIKNDKILLILFSYSITSFCGIYPIADYSHFIISGTITFITEIFFLNKIYCYVFSNAKNKIIKEILKILTRIFLTVCIVAAVIGIIYYIVNCKNYSNFENLKYIPINDSEYEAIIEVDEFIESEEDEVIILDASAALYMIPINRYNKDYDMMNCGNLGENGQEKIIEEIKNMDNVKFLIITDLTELNWQTPYSIIEYVLNNYTKTGEVSIFSIYEGE